MKLGLLYEVEEGSNVLPAAPVNETTLNPTFRTRSNLSTSLYSQNLENDILLKASSFQLTLEVEDWDMLSVSDSDSESEVWELVGNDS